MCQPVAKVGPALGLGVKQRGNDMDIRVGLLPWPWHAYTGRCKGV